MRRSEDVLLSVMKCVLLRSFLTWALTDNRRNTRLLYLPFSELQSSTGDNKYSPLFCTFKSKSFRYGHIINLRLRHLLRITSKLAHVLFNVWPEKVTVTSSWLPLAVFTPCGIRRSVYLPLYSYTKTACDLEFFHSAFCLFRNSSDRDTRILVFQVTQKCAEEIVLATFRLNTG